MGILNKVRSFPKGVSEQEVIVTLKNWVTPLITAEKAERAAKALYALTKRQGVQCRFAPMGTRIGMALDSKTDGKRAVIMAISAIISVQYQHHFLLPEWLEEEKAGS